MSAYAATGAQSAQNPQRARCEVNGSGRDCRILNLTAERVFVDSFVPVPTGTTVTLRFQLPNDHQIYATGVVSDHKFQVGFTVDFVDLSVQDQEQINRLDER